MSKLEAHEITIEVNANLAVSDKTASMCLLLLEMYMNAHPDIELLGHYDEKGNVSYSMHTRGHTGGGPSEYATD